jgi:hypothetical protein
MVPQADLARLFSWAERRGYALFPLPAWSKRPGPASWFRSHASDWSKDRRQWQAWYDATGGCNFGVECGPSDLIVGDVDEDSNGAAMFDEFWAALARRGGPLCATPGGGRHAYASLPAGVSAPGCRPWIKGRIDIRAGAAYVVAPWCVTRASVDPAASDGVYALLSDGEAPVAPPELIAHCRRSEAPDAPLVAADDLAPDGLPIDPGSRLQVEARIAATMEALRRAVPGQRNVSLNEASFELGRLVASGQMARALAESRLRAEGEGLGLTREEAGATARSGLNGARKSPESAPRSSLHALLAAAVPAVERPVAWRARAELEFREPIVERLLLPGCVTVLSGRAGTGKTTIGASLMAASVAGIVNFELPGGLDAPRSDVTCAPSAWVYVCWEGGQWIDAHMRAFRIGTGAVDSHPERAAIVPRREPWVCADGRRVVVDRRQSADIAAAIDATRRACPGLPLVVVFDNATSAVEDSMDSVQVGAFMRMCKATALEHDAAVLLPAHPPKSGHAAVYGSHVFVSLADIVGELEILKRDKDEWTQWISFAEKHRAAPNGQALELRSRRLAAPIVDLPATWGGNPKGRARALEDLRLPFIRQIRVRWDSEREGAKSGVTRVDAVTAKPVVFAPASPSRLDELFASRPPTDEPKH